MTRKERLRKYLVFLFWASLIFTIGFTYYYVKGAVPDRLNLVADEEEDFRFSLPVKVSLVSDSKEVLLTGGSNIPSDEIHLQLDQPFTLYSKNEGTYHLSMKLFGLFRFKDIQVDVSNTKYAVPCGIPIGIYMKSDGLMVIGTGEVTTKAGEIIDPADGLLKSGDYIEAINGVPAKDKKDMIKAVNTTKTEPIQLAVRRDGKEMDIQMSPVETAEGDYKLGVWIRDDTQGIGTMTYMDLGGSFGALGHGISDSDTGMLVNTSGGELYDTEIMGIQKGTFGSPGVMSGVIYYGNQSKLGTIDSNTEEGIFGIANEKLKNRIQGEAIPIGYRQDVKKGKATIRSNISGQMKDYQIEIQKVDYSSTKRSKDMVIKVTDPALLELTGGIVQGMSGSPIIQDGKLIGAVTHVFIQDSTRGYGIFIENMLEH